MIRRDFISSGCAAIVAPLVAPAADPLELWKLAYRHRLAEFGVPFDQTAGMLPTDADVREWYGLDPSIEAARDCADIERSYWDEA